MYNHKKFSKQIVPTETMLRENTVDPKANDKQAITEKEVPHRTGLNNYTTTEDQLSNHHSSAESFNILEKVLNEAEGLYVDHRNAEVNLMVPPINEIVEKARLNRLSEYKTEQDTDWTIQQKNENKKQQGSLPAWPKQPAQNDVNSGKQVLNNDPRRFSGETPSKLIGSITTANVDKVISAIKTGQTMDYDTAIVAILKHADDEQRELTKIEQKTISDLKQARTQAFLS